jgi:drug/metabolite transporter (DMT)-like permease
MGVLIAVAFVAALSALTRGSLTVVAVIVSQYPVVTILLVAFLWKQRPRGVQYLGVALALVAVGLIAAG